MHTDVVSCSKLIGHAQAHLAEQIQEQADTGETCAVKSDHCNIASHTGW
ncbi:hypothetical protein SFOMI_5102 [Sphingobium fuliginis]|uniref:Uncharacterized protein n=1 Tax=Sphingobium fuliginis (strain ATCC 27551) TaxID=336203 RepID=A0A292ZIG9_SPHSA|nr:hypothetical protein SFOMI_5102 [Sphingobium fuliginis]